MTPFIRLTTVTAVILALVSGPALGQEAEKPSNPAESLANQAIADLATWKNKSARKTLQKAKRGGFDPAMVHHQVGLSFLFSKQWEKARDQFDEGLEADPRYAPKLAPHAPDAGKARALLSAGGR